VWEERMGVDVFFVLSGMLMSNILFVDRMPLKDFYIRRFSRVIPGLVVFLLGALVISLLVGYDFKLVEFLASLFFVRTYFPVQPEYYSTVLPIGHLWSLSVEEHSYVIFSLISVVLLAYRQVAALLFSIYAFSLVICWYYYFSVPADQFEATLIRTESAIGFIAFSAGYNLVRKYSDIKVGGFVPVACIILAFFCYVRVLPIWMTFTFCPLLLGIAINHLLDSASIVRRAMRFAPLRWLGIVSFSVYLWQQVFYKLYYVLPGGLLTGLILSIIVGMGSYFLVEKPARRYINTRWSS